MTDGSGRHFTIKPEPNYDSPSGEVQFLSRKELDRTTFLYITVYAYIPWDRARKQGQLSSHSIAKSVLNDQGCSKQVQSGTFPNISFIQHQLHLHYFPTFWVVISQFLCERCISLTNESESTVLQRVRFITLLLRVMSELGRRLSNGVLYIPRVELHEREFYD